MADEKKTEAKTTTGTRGRKVILKDKNGKDVARVDVIKALYKDGNGKTRSEIVKILSEEYKHEVAYQIVFAATKPAKPAETTEATADKKTA